MPDLNRAVTVALRQAFGSRFEPTAGDSALCDDLERGQVTLDPHPATDFAVPLNWSADPFGQRNWCFQLHTLRWLDPLRRAAASGDLSRMRTWDRVVADWQSQNASPAQATSRWAWTDMGDAIRAQAILFGLPYSSRQAELITLLEEHGRWLADPAHLGHSNHAMHQHTGLFVLGAALDVPEWREVALDRLRTHFAAQYDEQGLNAEGAPGYWWLNLAWARQLKRRIDLEGADSTFLDALLDRTLDTVLHATRPDGFIEALGDTGREKFVDRSTPESEYVATGGRTGRPPATATAVFSGGFAFGRSGWGETERDFRKESFFSLSFGPSDRVHGHSDGGSITFAPRGVPLLVDAGKFAYRRHRMRDYVLSRQGHNVVTVDDAAYDPASVVRLLDHAVDKDYDYLSLRDEGYDGAVLRRQLFFVRSLDTLVVVDTVTGGKREVTATQRWHLAPGSVAAHARSAVEVALDGERFRLQWLGSAPHVTSVSGVESPFEGWVSPAWDAIEPATLVKSARTGRRFRFITVVSPASAPPATAKADEDGTVVVSLAGGVRPFRLRIGTESITPIGRGTGGRRAPSDERPGGRDVPELEERATRLRRAIACEEGDAVDLLGALDRGPSAGDYGMAAAIRDAEATWGRTCWDGALDERTRGGFALTRQPREGDGLPTRWYSQVPGRLAAPEIDAVHGIEAGPFLLQGRYIPGEGPLVVVFSGALDRNRVSLPRFERAASLRTLGWPLLILSDPTLDLSAELGLGWYFGSRGLDLPPVAASMVQAAARTAGSSRIVLAGSSGGGFAALQVSAYLPGSQVVVFNPQVSIDRYFPRFKQALYDQVLGVPDPAGAVAPARLDAATRLAESQHGPARVTYVLNSGDGHHRLHHQVPFFEHMASSRPDIALDLRGVDWGPGHISPSAEAFREIVSESTLLS